MIQNIKLAAYKVSIASIGWRCLMLAMDKI